MMKKMLLLGTAVCAALTVSGQSRTEVLQRQHQAPDKTIVDPSQGAPVATSFSKVASTTGIPAGHSANIYGCAFGPKSYLTYDPDLNTLVFTHRTDPAVTGDGSSGWLRYDISTDGGTTWTSDAGPTWSPNNTTTFNARYPQGTIFNPSGNTNPNNAYLVPFGPTLSATNGGSWGGNLMGSYKLDGTANNVIEVQTGDFPGINFLIAEDITFSPSLQKVFGLNQNQDLNVAGDYTDSVIVSVGTWDAGTSTVVFSHENVYLPVGVDPADNLNVIADCKIAFGPTGAHQQTGYITALGYNQTSTECYSPIVLKTTDGGATWSAPVNVDLDALNDVTSGGNLLTFYQSTYSDWTIGDLSTGFEHDLTVDANGNPHMIVNICPAAATSIPPGGATGTSFSIFSAVNGIVDIYSTDGGTTWESRYIDSAITFRGPFGPDPNSPAVTEDNRPQISRTEDGSILFYAWFDTDPVVWGTFDNLFPDCKAAYLEINGTTMSMGTPVNLTDDLTNKGTQTFGNVSNISFESSTPGEYILPVMIQEMTNSDPANDLLPTQFIYFPHPMAVGIGLEEEQPAKFEVSDNFPNPATGEETTVEVNMLVSAPMTLEVVNTVGQVVYSKDLGLMDSGTNRIRIPVGNLSSGFYFYTLRSNGSSISKKMIVE